MEYKQRSNRKKIDSKFFLFSTLITSDIENLPTYIEANDISESAISFKINSRVELSTTVDIIIFDIENDESIKISGKVSRVDEIVELENPMKKYKIVVNYDEHSNILLKRFL